MSTGYSNKVMTGPFVGKTKAEMRALLTEAQAELADGGSSVTGFSVNGQSAQVTAGPGVLTRIRLIQYALAQVDPDFIAPSSTIMARFGPIC